MLTFYHIVAWLLAITTIGMTHPLAPRKYSKETSNPISCYIVKKYYTPFTKKELEHLHKDK